MEDVLNQISSQIMGYISVPFLIIFMFLSYFIKKYFGTVLQKITRFDWKTVYTVLALATLVAIPFIIFSDESFISLVITYCVGTSAHELIFSKIEKKISG